MQKIIEQFGFVPALFRAQSAAPALLEAETALFERILWRDGGLKRKQKEAILWGVGSALGSEYVAALHYQMAQMLGKPDVTALRGIACRAAGCDAGWRMDETCSPDAVTEAILVAGLGVFEAAVADGLGLKPDFAPPEKVPVSEGADGDAVARGEILAAEAEAVRRLVETLDPGQAMEAVAAAGLRKFLEVVKKAHLSPVAFRHTDGEVPPDPDMEAVLRVQSGDLDAFEELIHRHSRRVYRTLLGILGEPDEARDAMQDTFLKAFQHLPGFRRESKFSTWLLSIASNAGVQRLRERRRLDGLEEDTADEEGFRPRQLQAWTNTPEQLYSQSERRALVESAVMRLPAKYRSVLMMRDIEQLSTEDAASALGLGIPALKARLLRGRLMLRESLAPHFTVVAKGAPR